MGMGRLGESKRGMSSTREIVPNPVQQGKTWKQRESGSSGGLHAGRGLQAELGNGQFAHTELLHLAGHGHREDLDELPQAWHLEGGDLARAKLHQLLFR